MVKKYAEEAYKEDNIPTLKEDPKPEHSSECPGELVKEFSDHQGGHWHCPVCGFWETRKEVVD